MPASMVIEHSRNTMVDRQTDRHGIKGSNAPQSFVGMP
tara:strand:- start:13659 stop:13772 length:114 start_codon:yes stop_codon:yes gene_type:complete